MKLVEAEAPGPHDDEDEGEAVVVTPPPPLHRRVSVSLLFTLTVLVGTVVAIYMVFPRRDNVLVTAAIAQHRQPPSWDLAQPTAAELRAWAIGVVGKEVPLPARTRSSGVRGPGPRSPRGGGPADGRRQRGDVPRPAPAGDRAERSERTKASWSLTRGGAARS